MKSRPILFSPEMVQAIQDGRKSQTRRVVKFSEPHSAHGPDFNVYRTNDGGWMWTNGPAPLPEWLDSPGRKCPYGEPGDELYVRETHYRFGKWITNGHTRTGKLAYRFKPHDNSIMFPNSPPETVCTKKHETGWFKRPSIFMPKWASRITLVVKSVRVERIQDISISDTKKEGMPWDDILFPTIAPEDKFFPRFKKLWDSINAKRGFSFDSNSWVFAIEFEVKK